MISVDPVDDRLVVDREDAPDAAEVHAFEVEAHRLALDVVGIAERQRLGRVDAGAAATLIPLAAAHSTAIGSLVFRSSAMRASAHAESLQHNPDLDTPLLPLWLCSRGPICYITRRAVTKVRKLRILTAGLYLSG